MYGRLKLPPFVKFVVYIKDMLQLKKIKNLVFIFQLTDTFCRKVAIKIISIRYIGLIIALYCDISTYMIVGGSALVIDKENIYF